MTNNERRLTRWQNFILKFKALWTYYRGWKWVIFLGLTMTLVLSSYLVLLAKTTSVKTLQEALKTDTIIYSVTDEEAGTLNGQKGTYIPLSQISDKMEETVVATEDKRFYEHSGFDVRGIARALLRMLTRFNASGGGGSTLTQQLAKNAFLTQDQTFERKFKELFLALELEKNYNKDQILEMYLNHSYFGNGVWGIEDASQKYFGHPASELDWNESAVLTGMLKGPSLYNPLDDYDASIDRRNTVISLLQDQQKITPDQAQQLKQSGIVLHDNYLANETYNYPYYFDAVINEAIHLAGIPEDQLLSGGYKIYTHLNTGYQRAIDNAYDNDWMFPDAHADKPLVQSASVVIQADTGGVAAIYGGRGTYHFRGFNRGIDMRRSPGSTIKPLAVYVPALESGLTVQSQLPDVVKGYGTNNYAPENYDKQTDPTGEVPMYYALAQSKNTTAVYLMDKLGIETSVKKLKQFGIPVRDEDKSLTLALGAFSQGVTVKEMASAYQAFANKGIREDSTFIRSIEDADGKVVYKNEKPRKHMVMTTNVAADMTSMMLDTFGGYGTSYGAGPTNGQIAGKSGSTEVGDGSMVTRDKWLIGYTPDFVIATWVGLDEIAEGQTLDELMPQGLGQLFSQQTTNLIAQSPQTPFQVTMASQMTDSTNKVTDLRWQDTAEVYLNQAQEWVEENGGEIWQKVQQGAYGLLEQIEQFLP